MRYLYLGQMKNACVKGNPTLPKFIGGNLEFFSDFLEKKNTILCILKGNMPFKMHKFIFFPEKK